MRLHAVGARDDADGGIGQRRNDSGQVIGIDFDVAVVDNPDGVLGVTRELEQDADLSVGRCTATDYEL